eukprot:jgi/Tetstr1/427962/TSEL_018036.t1
MWLRSPSFKGLTEADMWLRLVDGLLPTYDQPQPSEAATDQHAAIPADVLALAGVRARAEYEADTAADDAVICPPTTRTLLALMEVREFFRCAVTAKAICTGPLANLELPTVEQLAEAITATISQRINTPPELQHAQWLTDTMTAAGVEMYHHHTEPTLLRVGDDNLCAISLGQEDEEPTTSRPNPTATSSDPISPDRTPAPAATAIPEAQADDEEELELNYESDSAMGVDTTQAALHPAGTSPQPAHPSRQGQPQQPKLKKKHPRGRSRSDGATRNRSMSKPRLSGTRGSDSEWVTDDDEAQPSC